ncbi:MAG: hypothetical protein JNK25_04845 [Phycisphaerae bacterium]|nr:hypothetical protein [Phycisphaerae bacterium]
MPPHASPCRALAPLLAAAGISLGQDRQSITFQLSQNTTLGQSVYVLGDLPELGGGDLTRAVKLEPGEYPLWRAVISLPANRAYSYRFYLRSDAPDQQRIASNGTPIGSLLNGSTSPATLSPPTKALVYVSGWPAPILHWRQGSEPYRSQPLLPFGHGRTNVERRWAGLDLGRTREPVELYITPAEGSGRDPASGTYLVTPDAFLVQDGQVYTYTPAANPGAPRRDYNPSNPPSIASINLSGEVRRYRVLLPRGYDQHPGRRYPVIYMHDGQNIFEVGPFGTWATDVAAAAQVRAGAMRECIIVGIDNTGNRFADYTPPEDGGRGDRYTRFIRDELKTLIDGQYRTLPGPAETGAIGSSLGANISLYMGWQFTDSFTRVGALSGAWQATTLDTRAGSEAKRPIRIYLDSGDSGTSNDNYWLTYNLRDALIRPSHPGGHYALFGDIRHNVGFNQQHNEAAWAQRIGPALSYLFPGAEEPSPLMPLATGGAFDFNGDGRITIEDLYVYHSQPSDVNADGVADTSDAVALAAVIRRSERASLLSGRE